MSTIRIDKFLANSGVGTRSEVKKHISKGLIKIDGNVIKQADIKLDPDNNIVSFRDVVVGYKKYFYIMMNKPQNVVSATTDKDHKTVLDLLGDYYKNFNIFPVGRLDIDTVGLLILTNDGNFSHNTLSPKKHVKKTYYVETDKPIGKELIDIFKDGVILGDGYKCLPADLVILSDNSGVCAEITISEGKFHQIKRMFKSYNLQVVFLKRIKFGELVLDADLKEGNFRELTSQELSLMKNYLS